MAGKRLRSLRQYLVVGSVLLVLAVAAVLVVYPSRMYAQLFTQQAQGYSLDIATQTSTGVASSLYELDAKVDRLLSDPVIYNRLVRSAPQDKPFDLQFSQTLLQYFAPNSLDYIYLESLELYTCTGAYYAHGGKTQRLEDPFGSEYYHQALSAPTELVWVGYHAEMDCMEIARIIYDTEDYQVLGLLVMRLSKDFLCDKFKAYNIIEIQNMYIVDGRGSVLCSKDGAMLGGQLDEDYRQLMKKPYGSIQQGNTLAIYCYLEQATAQYPYRNWNTIIEVDDRELVKEFYGILRTSCLVAALIVAAGIFAAVQFSRRIAEPVTRLVHGMEEVQGGHLETRLEMKPGIREVQQLTDGFNRMSARLDELINTIYKEQLMLKEMRLKVLQSQINPHFLFNTLQLISWKAREYEAFPICDMIYSLSYMLEMDLYAKEENLSTLRDELQYIHHYAFLIQQKYQDKIQFRISVPPGLESCRIPKLAIQPFLENAVTHGLAQKMGDGWVSLTVSREEDELVITVEDNGNGIRPDRLQELRQGRVTPGGVDQGHNIALENIQSRIKILYGEPYGFAIDSKLYLGTTVVLRIPYRTEKGDETCSSS